MSAQFSIFRHITDLKVELQCCCVPSAVSGGVQPAECGGMLQASALLLLDAVHGSECQGWHCTQCEVRLDVAGRNETSLCAAAPGAGKSAGGYGGTAGRPRQLDSHQGDPRRLPDRHPRISSSRSSSSYRVWGWASRGPWGSMKHWQHASCAIFAQPSAARLQHQAVGSQSCACSGSG
jgi:hypothetical protein